MTFDLEQQNTSPASYAGDEKSSAMVEHKETAESLQLIAPESLNLRTTKYMVFFSFWIALGGWLVNFDLGYTGIVLHMEPFNRAFGSCITNPKTHQTVCALTAPQQSAVSVYVLWMAVGAASSSLLGSYMGRRNILQVACLLISIGAAGMLGSSGNYAAYIVCKCIGGIGIGQITAMCPVYGSECTPSKRRGLLVSVYSVGLALGAVVVSSVCLGTSRFTNDWAWKLPILLQVPVSIIYAGGLMMFPESPRWLLVRGQEEKSRTSFGRFYKKDPHSDDIDAQIHDIQATLELEKSQKSSWMEVFQKRYRRRTFTAAVIVIGSCLSGVNFVVPYATIFLADIGIHNPFQITVYLNLCIFGGCLVGPFPCQYLGRRITLMTGYLSMASCMLIFAAVATAIGPSTTTAKNVLVAFLCIWNFVFGAFNASTVWLSSAEQHSVRHRTHGQAFAIMFSTFFNFAANFWTPYMINAKYGNMGTNVGYFYFGLLCCYFFITFFLVPETGNLTLEQIDKFYATGGKAWKTSLKKNKMV